MDVRTNAGPKKLLTLTENLNISGRIGGGYHCPFLFRALREAFVFA